MTQIRKYLNRLLTLRKTLATNLRTMGRTTTDTELLDTLIPKVLTISADANALKTDIMSGKTAYVGGKKITGSYVPLNTSDATAVASDILPGKTAYVNGVKITGNSTAIVNPVNSFTINGTYATSTYYDSALSGYAVTPTGAIIIYIKALSASYEHIYYYANSLPEGVTLEESISSWDTSDPVAIYACRLSGITGKVNITVALDSINSTYDYVRASLTITQV